VVGSDRVQGTWEGENREEILTRTKLNMANRSLVHTQESVFIFIVTMRCCKFEVGLFTVKTCIL
jgi:hypothetical protein